MIADEHINQIAAHYEQIRVDKYVIMPNHVHMILIIEKDHCANAQQVIAQYKSGVSREIRKDFPGLRVWQRSFHDHVIRDKRDYEKIWLYIEGNPQNWSKDCFYTEFTDVII
jgi:REP element-mobilizing transposase RayT